MSTSAAALWDRFALADGDQPVFVTGRGTIDAATLSASGPIPDVGTVAGKCVALAVADPTLRCASMLWLDGVCGRMMLVPDDVSASPLMQAFCRSLNVDVIITDHGALPEAPPETALLEVGWPLVPQRSPPRSAPTEWVLVTSGTTGEPKLVAHRLATLTRTTRVGDPGRAGGARWGLLYDVFRFAGLQVFLQALIGRGTLILADIDAPLASQIAFLARHGCDSLSATPTRWRQILMTPQAKDLALRRVTLGGEIADDRILAELARRYPEAAIRHIYASTEAGVGFSVGDGRAGFPARFLDEPPAGVELQVRSDRLFLRPSVRGQYYLSGQTLEDADGFIDSGDTVVRAGDRFRFLGRASGSINVGGNKVLPEEVEAVLLGHDAVAMARVYPRRSPITGALVAADIVVDAAARTTPQLKRAVIEHCRSKLPPFKVPALLNIVDGFDVSAAGKIVRDHA